MDTYSALLKSLKWCQSADECISLPGTSCGCTNNLVVSENSGQWLLWDLTDKMAEAGCSPFISTCDCPPADGFICDNNQCQWNYL